MFLLISILLWSLAGWSWSSWFLLWFVLSWFQYQSQTQRKAEAKKLKKWAKQHANRT